MTEQPHGHVPVLGPEVVVALSPTPGDLVIDAADGVEIEPLPEQ